MPTKNRAATQRRATAALNAGNGRPIWDRGIETTFGSRLRNPDFTDLDGFDTRIGKLDTVAKRPAMYKAANNRPVEASGHFAIVSAQKGDVYGYVSPSYQPVQDEQVLKPLYAAAQQAGLNVRGALIQTNGRLHGYVVLHDEAFRFEPGDKTDTFGLGVKAFNSYNAETSFGAETFGIRRICGNYNIWGDWLGSVRSRHQGDLEKLIESFGSLFERMLKAVPKMKELLETAMTVVVEPAQMEDLLWGLGTGVRLPKTLGSELTAYAPEVKKLGLNAYTLYNGVTAYATWRKGSERVLATTEQIAEAAMALLTDKHDAILERGKIAHAEYEEEQKRKEAAKAEAKVVATA